MLTHLATLCQTKPPHVSDHGATVGLRSAPPCPRCGYDDLHHYDQEVPICPGCRAVLVDDPQPQPSFLAQFPTNRRSTIAQCFYTAVRAGQTDPAQVVWQVLTQIEGRLVGGPDVETCQFWRQVANTLADDRKAAQEFAVTVLHREQLPAEEKARLRAEAARRGVLAAMAGKPVTDKQRWLLRSKGYTGMPRDRAEASAIIDSLLRTGGRR